MTVSLPRRQLTLLEALLRLSAPDLPSALSQVSDLIADASGADKIDVFLYESARDSLVAVGTSRQPLSVLERQLGLDVLPLSNGGRAVHVFRTGETYLSGRVDEDAEELRGIKEALSVRSAIGVPLVVGGERRGALLVTAQKPELYSADDARFIETVSHWVGVIAHRAELAEAISREAVAQGRRAAAEELVTVLAHDLRNLLAPLGLRIEMLALRAQREAREDDTRDLAAASRHLRRVSDLVTDILDVARIDQGLFGLEREPLDLAALARETAAVLATPQRPVSFHCEPEGPVAVAGDAGRLRQCLENVIANALQKTPAGAAVRVDVRLHGRTAVVEIVDEGPGIPEELLPHVFERFTSGSRRQGGLGLGLYLAKRIAAVHGGDLTAESAPGKGARFRLTLPSAGTSAAPPGAGPASLRQ